MQWQVKEKKNLIHIISSNKPRSVKEIFSSIKRHYKIKNKLIINSKYKKPSNRFYLLGNNQKLLKKINWKPTTNLQKIVSEVLN